MGIDLGDLVLKHPTTLKQWNGKWVAVDAWNILYQFLSSIRQRDGTPLMNAQGEVTSHLAGILYRTSSVVDAGIKPVWVFDGAPHPLKTETLAARTERRDAAQQAMAAALEAGDDELALSKAKQTSRMSSAMAAQAMELLRALGIPVVEAPQDGEAQASWMCQEGIVDAVVSQDFDCMLYGAPRLLRNLTASGRRKLPGKQVWVDVTPESIRLDESLEAAGMSREQLVDAAILVGTDFNPGIKGIGPKKAVALIKKDGSLEGLVERLGSLPDAADTAAERAILEQHEALMDRDTIRRLFLAPEHTDASPEMGKPDGDAVRAIMVDRFGFAQDRVDSALEKFGAARARASQQSLFDY